MQGLAESLAQHAWAWWAIIGLGAFHGINPGMGWLFAVSNGMQAQRTAGVLLALPPIAAGHFLAMGVVLLPFAVFALYLGRLSEIEGAAALLLVIFGAYKLVYRRHPRFLNRIGPPHLVLWSFLMATAHGAGLMLVPVVLDLCSAPGAGHSAHQALREVAGHSVGLSLVAATVHTLAMVLTGGTVAWVVYRYLGLALLRRAWVNLDLVWGAVLVIVAGIALAATSGWQS
jgi:hypothetical protein